MPQKRKPLIFLAEDDPEDAELIKKALERSRFDCDLEVVPNGEVLLEAARQSLANSQIREPDMILLDLNMPLMNGQETLRALRADKKTAKIPVIVLSSSNGQEDVNESFALGVDSYFVKPNGFSGMLEFAQYLKALWSKK